MTEDRISVDRAEWDRTQARLRALEEVVARMAAPAPALPPPPAQAPDVPAATSRRRALIGMAGAAAGAAAIVVGQSQPAAANGQGQSLTLGDTNTATSTTSVIANLPGAIAGQVQNSANGSTGFRGIASSPSGISSTAGVVGDSLTSIGTSGISRDGYGTYGQSTNGAGVVGLGKNYGVQGNTSSATGLGVYGVGSGGAGVGGYSSNGPGVLAASNAGNGITSTAYGSGNGITATSSTGYGVVAGAPRQLRLIPTGSFGPPAPYQVGEVVCDADGVFYAATASGWRRMAGPLTAGSLHLFDAPLRAYDSRPGTSPSTGPKTKLAANVARTISLAGTGVDTGARAALLTILLVNATAGNGNFTVWKNGVAKPTANTLVWGGATGRFTVTATCGLDSAARLQVSASLTTDVVVDVAGYYA